MCIQPSSVWVIDELVNQVVNEYEFSDLIPHRFHKLHKIVPLLGQQGIWAGEFIEPRPIRPRHDDRKNPFVRSFEVHEGPAISPKF